MCAMPLINKLGETSICRISLYFYNTTEEIDNLINSIKKAKEIFEI